MKIKRKFITTKLHNRLTSFRSNSLISADALNANGRRRFVQGLAGAVIHDLAQK